MAEYAGPGTEGIKLFGFEIKRWLNDKYIKWIIWYAKIKRWITKKNIKLLI